MKQVKRCLAILLVLCLCMGVLPTAVWAEEEPQSTVDTGEVTLESSDGFSALLSENISESQEQMEESASAGYGVTELIIEGNVATVTYNSLEAARLVVSIYTEDSLQLLTSGTANVSPENTVATVTIEGEMPEYFMAAAYLLDCYDFSPLCQAYDTPLYTREMQELLASTIHDYDADRVLNLDESETTNFAVYAEDAIVIEQVEGVNTVTSADEEAGVYVIENADATVLALRAGDIFVYPYDEDILIAKVASIEISGTTVTITGAELEMEEVFDYVKMESEYSSSEFTYDGSEAAEGVVYSGYEVNNQKEARSSTRKPVEGEPSGTFYHHFDLSSPKLWAKLTGGETTEFSVKGGVALQIDVHLKYFFTRELQYVRFALTTTTNWEITFNGTVKNALIPIGDFPVTMTGKLGAKVKVEIALDVSGYLTYGQTNTSMSGFEFKNGKFTEISSNPQGKDPYAEVEASCFVGLRAKPYVDLGIADIYIYLKIGVNISAAISFGSDNVETKHDCSKCQSVSVDFVGEIGGGISRKGSDWGGKLTMPSIPLWSIPLGTFYYSHDYDEWGEGVCPHLSYRVTIQVMDESSLPVKGVAVFANSGKLWGVTNSNGILIQYVPAGDYKISATISGEAVEKTVAVKEAEKITLMPGQSNAGGGSAKDFFDNLDAGQKDSVTNYGEITDSGSLIGPDGKLTWTLYGGELLVISGTGAMPNFDYYTDVPWEKYASSITRIEIEHGATSIGDWAFCPCSSLTSVTIPSSVSSIGNRAFEYCSSLTSVTIPSSVTSIGDNAFFECSSLASVTIPNSVTSIGGYAFAYCRSLTSITIPSSVTSIGDYAFFECSSLTAVTIPNSVTSIGDDTFAYCRSLTSVTIPNSVTSIGRSAFAYCRSLTSITIPNSVTSIGGSAFEYCSSLTSITIPNSVTSIGGSAFEYCSSLTSITIPNSVTSIGGYAFCLCSSLTKIRFTGNAPSINNDVFYRVKATVYYPEGNATWTSDVMQSYGGTITWVPYSIEVAAVGVSEEYGSGSVSGEKVTVDSIQTLSAFGGEYGTEISGDYTLKTAAFSGLVAGESYVLLAMVSLEAEDLLSAENLLYIDQGVADEDGKLSFAYIQREDTAVSYVMACGPSNQNLADAEITFPKMTADLEENAVKPTVRYNGELLEENVDYVLLGDVSYTEVGTYTCYIRGVYDYTGLVECVYTVGADYSVTETTADSVSVSWSRVSDAVKYWVYVDGKIHASSTEPEMTVRKLTPATSYELSVSMLLQDGTIECLLAEGEMTVTTLEKQDTVSCTSTADGVTLNWSAESCEKAWIYKGTSADSLKLYTSDTDGCCEISGLAAQTTYFFRVDYLRNGKIVSGQVQEVTTSSDSVPNATVVTDGENVVVSWQAYEESYKYWIVLDGKVYASTTDTQFTLKSVDLTEVSVSVMGINAEGMYDYVTVIQ